MALYPTGPDKTKRNGEIFARKTTRQPAKRCQLMASWPKNAETEANGAQTEPNGAKRVHLLMSCPGWWRATARRGISAKIKLQASNLSFFLASFLKSLPIH